MYCVSGDRFQSVGLGCLGEQRIGRSSIKQLNCMSEWDAEMRDARCGVEVQVGQTGIR